MCSHQTSPRSLPPLCIVGGGAVGLTLAILSAPYRDTRLLVKREQRPSLLDKPLTLTGARTAAVAPREIGLLLSDELGALPPDTHFWIAVKAYDLDRALDSIRPHLTERTPVAVLSNGLGIFMQAAERLQRAAPVVRVLPSFGAAAQTAGAIALAGEIVAAAAAPADAAEFLDAIEQSITTIGGRIHRETNVALAEWKKAAVNMIVNPLCSLANSVNGAIIEDPTLRALVGPLLGEILTVAERDGFDLSALTVESFLQNLAPHTRNTNSMLVDLQRGRRTEIDFITGRFLRLAAHYGIPAPLHRSLFELVKARETRAPR